MGISSPARAYPLDVTTRRAARILPALPMLLLLLGPAAAAAQGAWPLTLDRSGGGFRLIDASGAEIADVSGAVAELGHPGSAHVAWSFHPLPGTLLVLEHPQVGPARDVLSGIDVADGRVRWRRLAEPRSGGFLVVAPLPDPVAPLILTRDGISVWHDAATRFVPRIRAIDPATGLDRWSSLEVPDIAVRLVADTHGAVVVASRCGWAGTPACATAFVALDRGDGRVRWRLHHDRDHGPDRLRWDVAAPWLHLGVGETLVAMDVRDARQRWSVGLGADVSRIVASDRDVAVLTRAGLQVRAAADGAVRFTREGRFHDLAFAGERVSVASALDHGVYERVALDRDTGAPRCRRFEAALRPTADVEAWTRSCGDRPVEITVTGVLRVDGRPRARVGVLVHHLRVVTDRRGRYRATLDATGRVRVRAASADLGRPGRPCVEAPGEVVSLDGSGEVVVDLAATERRAACSYACSPRDCE